MRLDDNIRQTFVILKWIFVCSAIRNLRIRIKEWKHTAASVGDVWKY